MERTLETFCSMNLEMAESANLARINKQHLLQLVAENNIVMTEIISKLGVHERWGPRSAAGLECLPCHAVRAGHSKTALDLFFSVHPSLSNPILLANHCL